MFWREEEKKESEFCFGVSVTKVEKRRVFGRKWREAKNKGGEPICCSFDSS